jgi:hypothetical protein
MKRKEEAPAADGEFVSKSHFATSGVPGFNRGWLLSANDADADDKAPPWLGAAPP